MNKCVSFSSTDSLKIKISGRVNHYKSEEKAIFRRILKIKQ